MFNTLLTRLLDEWSQTMTTSLKSTVQWAKVVGNVVDEVTWIQWNQFNLYFLANIRKICHTWEVFIFHGPGQGGRSRVAVVTNGTQGLATAICKELARSGNQVVATYHSCEEDSARDWQSRRFSEGYDIAIVECDTANFDSCANMTREVGSRFGAVDILVHCATMAENEKDNRVPVLDAQLDSFFNVIKQVIDGMVERQYGRIIHISAVNGPSELGPSPARAGMLGFTKSLAREFADQGVTVNTIFPDPAEMGLVMAIPEWENGFARRFPEEGYKDGIDEIVQAVVFLTGDASDIITGPNIPVREPAVVP